MFSPKNSPRLLSRVVQSLMLGSSLVSFSTLVAANDSKTTSSALPTIEVTAANSPSDPAATENSKSYAAKAVSIFKGAKDPLTVSSTVSTLTNQRLEDQNIVDTRDAILQLPGVSVQRIGESDTFRSRAYELSTQVDGVPIEAGGLSNIYDVATYDRIEVLRGPAGSLQGKSNIGGVVNLVRKRPQQEFAASTELAYGSWANQYLNADVTGALNRNKSIRGRLIASGQKKDYFYDEVNNKQYTLYGVMEFDLSKNTTLGLTANHSHRDRHGQYFGVPQALTWQVPRSTYFGQKWTGGEFESSEFGVDLTHKFASEWSATVKALYRENQYAYKYHQPIVVGSLVMHRFNNMAGDSKNYALDSYITGPFRFWNREHSLTLGANYNFYDNVYGSTSSQQFDFTGNVTKQYDEPTWNELTYTANKTEQWGAYIQGQFELLSKRLFLNTGGRISEYKFQYKNHGQTSFTDYGTASGQFTPYAGLIFKPTQNTSIYASYADVFQPQTQTDFYGRTLDPIIGDQYEVGVKGSFFDGRLNTSIAYYDLDETNKPVRDPDPTHTGCGGGSYCYVAAGRIKSRGVDVEVSGNPLKNLHLQASYNYNTNKYEVDDYYANTPYIFSSPKHQFKLWSNYYMGDAISENSLGRWNIGVGVRAQSKMSFDADSQQYGQGGYVVYDTQVGYQINPYMNVKFSVNNVFDREYLDSVYLYNFFGEPRNYMLTLKLNTK